MNASAITPEPEVRWNTFRLQYALERLKLSLKAYDSNQPRAPGGTEEAGQWISANSDSGSINLAGGFEKEHMGMKVQDFIAQMCKGGVYEVLPKQFLGMTVEELIQAKRAGVDQANTCFKLLHRNEYRK